jgi:Cu-Zn family superoxide dismutase
MRMTLRYLAAVMLPLVALSLADAQDKKKADPHGDVHAAAHAEPAMPKKAVAVLIPTEGSKVGGVLTLVATDKGVHVTGKVTGLTPGDHGFHIHEFGDLSSADGTAAGGHYNPDGHMHGGPDSKEKHAGDLGNIKANNDGVAMVDVKTDAKLHFIIGRAFVVHAKADDLKTQPTGDAGGRVALGLIGIANDKPPMKK